MTLSFENDWKSVIKHPKLAAWLEAQIALLKPKSVYLVDGSEEENKRLLSALEGAGVVTKLNEKLRPNCYLTRTDPGDTARSEARTFICTQKKEDAGPTNNWCDPAEMRARLNGFFDGAMAGRTMYVIPFCMGPIGSPLSRIGIEITDSAYVTVSMRIMATLGTPVLEQLGTDGDFVPCVHSVGVPLKEGDKDSTWPCNLEDRHIVHFPETHEIFSYGSGYGGNSLLGKKCFALRIASWMAREEGTSLAEHMLILGLTSPEGKKHYVCAAFPSACGKTNLAMLTPTIPGWKVETVGDDIAWMKLGADGRLWAINPEAGFFGVAPGTSMESNPNALLSLKSDSLFTNVALTADGDVWWEGLTDEPPAGDIITWTGDVWNKDSGVPKPNLAHPNSRFTVSAASCPVIDPNFQDPQGVPISAIIFGGRRETTVPLVFETRSWEAGVLAGSAVASERTAAAEGKQGELRHDPFAMLPFCGYNMADYWGHWLSFPGKTDRSKLPRIFHVNWFRRDASRRFLWPGYGDNSRVLKWMIDRIEGQTGGVETPIGTLPRPQDLELTGCNVRPEDLETILSVDKAAYLNEIESIREYHAQFGERLPEALKKELAELEARLKA